MTRIPSLVFATLVAALLLTLGPSPAGAQTITVTTTSMARVNDSICTLPEAVQAINNQASYQGCSFTPSSQPDRIRLQQSGTFSTSAEMTASRTMEIIGNGRSSTVISTGGIWGFGVRNGALLSLQDLTVEKSSQTLPVMCVYVDGASLELDNVRVAACNSRGVTVHGLGASNSAITIVNSLIENNTGGGITSRLATLTIQSSVIRNNAGSGLANSVGSDGDGQAYIYDTLIENNSASRGAGVYVGDSGSNVQVHFDRCLIRDNVATNEGGGLYSKGQFTMTNTTVTGNRGTQGAGVYHDGAEFQIRHSTISGNGGPGTTLAGGVYARGGNRIFAQTIVANNSATVAPDVSGTFLIAGQYNLIENVSGSSGFFGTDITGVDPMLGGLHSIGGPTSVLPLLAGSPAIDAVPAATGSNAVDQRGSPRQTSSGNPRNGDDGAGRLGYDIGAFEQGAIESEFLTLAAKTSSVSHTLLTGTTGFSKLDGTRLDGSSNGHYVTYAVPVLTSGTYSFRIRVQRGGNCGIYQVATANSLNGTYTNRGSTQDLYAASPQFAELTLGSATVNFSSAGTKYIRFTVTGKNAAATRRNIYLDWIQLEKQ